MSNTTQQLIRISGIATTRDEAINEAADLLIEAGAVTPDYRASMFARESSVSTYMGNFLAIPHGTLEGKDDVLHSALAIIRYEKPISWDGEEVRFVIGIAGKNGTHMDALAMVAGVFSDTNLVDQMLAADNENEVKDIFAKAQAA